MPDSRTPASHRDLLSISSARPRSLRGSIPRTCAKVIASLSTRCCARLDRNRRRVRRQIYGRRGAGLFWLPSGAGAGRRERSQGGAGDRRSRTDAGYGRRRAAACAGRVSRPESWSSAISWGRGKRKSAGSWANTPNLAARLQGIAEPEHELSSPPGTGKVARQFV